MGNFERLWVYGRLYGVAGFSKKGTGKIFG